MVSAGWLRERGRRLRGPESCQIREILVLVGLRVCSELDAQCRVQSVRLPGGASPDWAGIDRHVHPPPAPVLLCVPAGKNNLIAAEIWNSLKYLFRLSQYLCLNLRAGGNPENSVCRAPACSWLEVAGGTDHPANLVTCVVQLLNTPATHFICSGFLPRMPSPSRTFTSQHLDNRMS